MLNISKCLILLSMIMGLVNCIPVFTYATLPPEKINFVTDVQSINSKMMSIEYIRNGQTYQSFDVDISQTTLVNQVPFKFEYLQTSMFYTTILETPIYTNNNFTFYPSQLNTLTIQDQINLNEIKTSNVDVNISGYIILAAANVNGSGYFFHAGVLIYTDGVINFLVPYFSVSPNSLSPV